MNVLHQQICDRGEFVSWNFFGVQSERSIHNVFINTYSKRSIQKNFFSLLTSLFTKGNMSLIFSAPQWIPCARHIICSIFLKQKFKILAACTMYGAALVTINKTFSSKLLKLKNLFKLSFTNWTMVSWFVFSSDLHEIKKYFLSFSGCRIPITRLATKQPRPSVVSPNEIYTKLYRFSIRKFCIISSKTTGK